jgi:hypothetical protein
MARGIIYCMTTIVDGLVKIGKTGKDNFEQRMYNLEHNGYVNITGLKREFAIEVEDYDEKEQLIHSIFSKSNVQGTELFAIDKGLVIQLLSSFDGKQVYPKNMTKEEVFGKATDEVQKRNYAEVIPDGEYYFARKVKDVGIIDAKMKVKKGVFIVLKGSKCIPLDKNKYPDLFKKIKIKDGVLQEDVECNSPSTAGIIVLGKENNGWVSWKDKNGNTLDYYRKNAQ